MDGASLLDPRRRFEAPVVGIARLAHNQFVVAGVQIPFFVALVEGPGQDQPETIVARVLRGQFEPDWANACPHHRAPDPSRLGLDFEFAAILVNVIAGAVAAVCLFTLVSRFADRAAALLVSAALTRGATVPLSAAALWYVWRYRAARRPSALVLMVAALAAPFLWIGIAAVVTGRRDAYAATQRAWATRRT